MPTTLILLVGLASAPAYPRLGTTELYAVGWSDKGLLAVAQYHESNVVAQVCALRVTVQNLVDDEVVFNHEQSWEEELRDDVPNGCPGSFAKAWKAATGTVQPALDRLGMKPWPDGAGLEKLPARDGNDRIDVTLEARGNDTYELEARSESRGRKTIAKLTSDNCKELKIAGYVRLPKSSRVAVVVEASDDLPFCPAYKLAGCNLKTGFAPTR